MINLLKKQIFNIITNSLGPLFLCALLWPLSGFTQDLKVVVSINPFYTLAAALMKTVGTPTLLLNSGASPHHYHLRPSDQQKLNDADLIFWGGPDLEAFLVKPLANRSTAAVALVQTPGLILRPVRQSIQWDATEEHSGHQHAGNVDMHFWLDPQNAIMIIETMLKHLIQIDPLHISIYEKNAQDFIEKLHRVDRALAKNLKSIGTVPYLVFHDAYQYFDRHYALNGVGAINLHPELPPSVHRLSTIRQLIEAKKVKCIFSEPQFSTRLVDHLSTELNIKTAVLDPIGTDSSANGYFHLLEQLSTHLKTCLAH